MDLPNIHQLRPDELLQPRPSDRYAPEISSTQLELLLRTMHGRIRHADEINGRLSVLVTKLCGNLPPSDRPAGARTSVSSGLVGELRDAAANLGTMQEETIDLIKRLATAV